MKLVPAYASKAPNFYKKLGAKEVSTTQLFEDIMSESSFPLPPVVNEGNAFPLADFQTFQRRSYTWRKRGLGYVASSEKVETDQYAVMDKTGRKLARAFYWGDEVEYHNAFNLGFTTFTTADAQPWFSTAHPLETGVASNRGVLSGAAFVDVALSYTGVMQATAELMRQVGHRGEPMPFMGPFRLHVSPRNGWIGQTIVNSNARPSTTDNDSNEATNIIRMVNTTPYLTSDTAWFLTQDDEDVMGLFCLNMRGLQVRTRYEESLDRYEYFANKIFRVWAHDWRGVWGTTG